MQRRTLTAITFTFVLAGLLLAGCSPSSTGPALTSSQSSLATESVIAQDVSQLKSSGIAGPNSVGVFSVGWNQFVGPNIVNAGTMGKAYAVVRNDTALATRGRGGIDIGTVTLWYNGSSTELTKLTTPLGEVLYSTFPRGLHDPQSIPENIPFIAGAVYRFDVTGSSVFSAGSFAITAPPSLLDITSHANGDSISASNDLTITWSGGSTADSVLMRIVPHLRRDQMERREGAMGGGHHGRRGRHGAGHGPGLFADMVHAGMPFNLGPEFHRGIVRTVANTGFFTLSAAELQSILAETEAGELMVGVAQEIALDVDHDGKPVTILLRNGDRLVLLLR